MIAFKKASIGLSSIIMTYWVWSTCRWNAIFQHFATIQVIQMNALGLKKTNLYSAFFRYLAFNYFAIVCMAKLKICLFIENVHAGSVGRKPKGVWGGGCGGYSHIRTARKPVFHWIKVSSCANRACWNPVKKHSKALVYFAVSKHSYRIFGRPWLSRNKSLLLSIGDMLSIFSSVAACNLRLSQFLDIFFNIF